jgi:hypothetical protein
MSLLGEHCRRVIKLCPGFRNRKTSLGPFTRPNFNKRLSVNFSPFTIY